MEKRDNIRKIERQGEREEGYTHTHKHTPIHKVRKREIHGYPIRTKK